MRNIYLVGMMGSGKSETARALAEILSMKAVDLDDLIVQEERRSINEIFEENGEAYFREVEAKILRHVSVKKNQVIATGGGTVLREDNRHVLLQTGKVIYLKTTLEMLWERLKGMKDRPLLKSADPKIVLERIFEERRPYYECFEDWVDTDMKTPEDVAREIAEMLEE